MKVLVSTKLTQGQRPNDFSFVEDDELVLFGWRCSFGHTDDDCGCHRSVEGLVVQKGTTTVKVVERDLTLPQLAKTIEVSMVEGGHKDGGVLYGGRKIADVALEQATRLTEAAARFNVGTVLEYRDDVFSVRTKAS